MNTAVTTATAHAIPSPDTHGHHLADAMPISSIPISLTVASALGIPLAAFAAVVSPAPDSYTLLGAAFAVFCIVAYIRMKQPHTGVWVLLFNSFATLAVGWFMPEPTWHIWGRIIGIDHELTNKGWASISFIIGLGGGALVTSVINKWRKNSGKLVDAAGDKLGMKGSKSESRTDSQRIRGGEEGLWESRSR